MSLGTVLVGITDGARRARTVATLERAELDVVEVHDGGRVLDLARRFPPDVIVVHRDLTRPDALEVARRLTSDVATRSIPIVIVGKGTDGEAAEAFDAGAAAVLPETVGEKDLTAHVRTLAARGGAKPVGESAQRRLLLDLARAMSGDRDPRAGLHAAVQRIAEATGAVRAGVLLLSAGGKRAFVMATWPVAHDQERLAIANYPALARAVADGRWTSDEDPIADPFSHRSDGGSLLAFPILH
ncbi:MAG: response regulator, partial [Vicinamibacteria bacterium]